MGPHETSSMGNLIMQLKASGKIGSLKEGREIAAMSSNIDVYEPEEVGKREESFNYYLQLFKLKI